MAYEDLNVTHNPSDGAVIPTAWGDKVRDNQEDHESRVTAIEANGGPLKANNNLSDVPDAPTARANLVLGNVDNTSDANKPVSTAQQTALDAKVNKATFDANTILKADSDDTPVALSVAEQRVVGRLTGGSIAALTGSDLSGFGLALQVDVQAYTTAGQYVWTKPTNAKLVEALVFGGGSGGGSGRKGANGTVRCGGGGAAGACMSRFLFLASQLNATENITVGAGGAGGVSVTANDTNGNDGVEGGDSWFGGTPNTRVAARVAADTFAAFGKGGSAASGVGGGATYGSLIGTAGGSASVTGGAGGPGPLGGQLSGAFPGSGAGGGITSGDVAGAGGAGGRQAWHQNAQQLGGTVPGGNGADGLTTNSWLPGSSPGGGAASTSGNAGRGGHGVWPGGGGGGGGAAVNGVGNSGAGGNGADGLVVVITYF